MLARADFRKLISDIVTRVHEAPGPIAVLGTRAAAEQVLLELRDPVARKMIDGIFDPHSIDKTETNGIAVRPLADLARTRPAYLVVAADDEKEDLLWAALPHIRGAPRVILAGYGQYKFKDRTFAEEVARLEVPSFANGYPNSLVHLYQCLVNASRLGLNGSVAEFGMFRGGTTMFLSRVVERLGERWPVIGFDTFGGFPPRRSPLDMYDDLGCVFTDVAGVKSYLAGRNVEIVQGDIAVTRDRLRDEKLVLSFMDTDNYTPASRALEIVRENTVVGGSIVFDHVAGVDRFRYTLGEKMAARVLEEDPRYFHLHGTGVFYRQR